MYVILFSMGFFGFFFLKIGIQLTDLFYVVVSMRIMTRMGTFVLEVLGDGEFVKCFYFVGCFLFLKSKCIILKLKVSILKSRFSFNFQICVFGIFRRGRGILTWDVFFCVEFLVNNWVCNLELIFIVYLFDRREIIFFGSGYGGNSFFGKKCFVFRMVSRLVKEEGWLVEYMLVRRRKFYVCMVEGWGFEVGRR